MSAPAEEDHPPVGTGARGARTGAASARRPRGRVLMIVGPDGTGKTTLCDALMGQLSAHAPVRVLAKRPGAERPGILPHRKPRGTSSEPHRYPAHAPMLSMAKVLYYVLNFHLGWLVKIAPFVARGGWVIVERGWWDVLVDPLRYRMQLPGWLRHALAHIMPRPALVLVLEAPVDVITARKAQLPVSELVRQMNAWREILPSNQRRLYLDTSAPMAEVLQSASRAIAELGPAAATTGPASVPGDSLEAPRTLIHLDGERAGTAGNDR